MRRSCSIAVSVPVTAVLISTLGCWGGPTAISVPLIDPSTVTEAAFSEYDTNGDGALDAKELEQSPSMRSAMRSMDKDQDGRLSQDELTKRVELWVVSGIGALPARCVVYMKGRPLGGALVKMIPEEFLGGVVHPAEGTTSSSGKARMSMDKEHLPKDMQRIPVVQQGFYRVEITHPNVQIDSKYNTNSTLGLEVTPVGGRDIFSFNL